MNECENFNNCAYAKKPISLDELSVTCATCANNRVGRTASCLKCDQAKSGFPSQYLGAFTFNEVEVQDERTLHFISTANSCKGCVFLHMCYGTEAANHAGFPCREKERADGKNGIWVLK